MNSLELIDIDKNNWETFCSMWPGDEGANFVSTNAYSLTQSYFEGFWITKGITYEDKPVGFAMYGFDQENKRYELCRLMIDSNYQGKGFGKNVIPMIIADMTNRFECKNIFLSTGAKNQRAIKLYKSFGFLETGEVLDNEVVFCLDV